jgi:uncharacterized protein (DUF2267 family)
MPHAHVFESYVTSANKWLEQLMTILQLEPGNEGRALHALRAGLHAIRDRLPAAEVLDLGAQLPTIVRGIYFEGWTLTSDPTRIRDRGAMVERVRRELRPDQIDPLDVLSAVIALLVEHVSRGELEDVVATLPRSIASLWQELAAHWTDAPAPAVTRRTGYST